MRIPKWRKNAQLEGPHHVKAVGSSTIVMFKGKPAILMMEDPEKLYSFAATITNAPPGSIHQSTISIIEA